MALYATVVVRSLLRLMRERDPFIRLAGTGLACMFGVQAMINMGVAVRLLPAKGMTLPLRQLRRLVGDRGRDHGRGAAGVHAQAAAGTRSTTSCSAGPLMAAPLLVIAAGGTGGHMFPAQALAEAMLARGWRVKLSTDARGARYAGGFPPAVERQVTAAGDLRAGRACWRRSPAPFAIAAGARWRA